MVMPRAFSSGAASIWSYALASPPNLAASTDVIAAVSVVFPWSTCPIVPTFTCGLVRANFSLAIQSILLHDCVGDVLWHFDVLGEFHGEGGAALAHRAHIGRVAEHLGERHFRGDHLAGSRLFHAHDLATPAVEIADDVAVVIFRSHHFDFHDRLEQHGPRPHEAFLEADGGCDLERHSARVDIVVRTVEGRNLHVDHGITREHAGLHRLLDALVHRRNVFARHGTADDAVDELIALAGFLRLESQPDVAVLAAAAGLAHELALLLDFGANRLAIGYLRLADVGLDLELALHAIDDDFEVQLAHAGDDRLAGLLVGAHAE